jgi:hypothetical protein
VLLHQRSHILYLFLFYRGKRYYHVLSSLVLYINKKTKVWATRTLQKLQCSGRDNSSYNTSCICHVTLKRHEYYVIWESYWTPLQLNIITVFHSSIYNFWSPFSILKVFILTCLTSFVIKKLWHFKYLYCVTTIM